MSVKTEIALLFIGFFAIIGISRLISHRIEKQFSHRIGSIAHLFVGSLALYHLIDVMVNTARFFHDRYFYFWLLMLLSQAALTVYRLGGAQMKNDRSTG